MQPEGFHALVQRARDGDRQAMDEVLSILRPYLESLARPYADPVRPSQSTADLLQESCLRAWQRLDTFEGGANDGETFAMFRAWIGQIVRRLGLNVHRERRDTRRRPPKKILSLDRRSGDSTRAPRTIEPPAPEKSPSSFARAGEEARRIEEALLRLGDEEAAELVRMHFLDGMTFAEISERMGLEYDEVRDRVRATMRRLQKDLRPLL